MPRSPEDAEQRYRKSREREEAHRKQLPGEDDEPLPPPVETIRSLTESDNKHSPFVMVDVEDAVALTEESITKARRDRNRVRRPRGRPVGPDHHAGATRFTSSRRSTA